MSEKIKKLLVNTPQEFTELEKAQGRANLGIGNVSDHAVLYDQQILTSSQKDQARANIDAAKNAVASQSNNGLMSITDKVKLDGIEAGAEVNVQSDWNQSNTSADDYIKNKPSIPAAQIQSDWNQSDNTKVDFIKNKPTIPATQVNSDWNASSGVAEILNKPTLATVATSGSYTDLSNTPSIPAAQVNSDWNATSGVSEILNKPTIPAAQVNSDWNATSGVAQILNKPESKYFLWDTTSANGFGIWADIYDASDHYNAWLPICLLDDDPDNPGYNHAILHTNFGSTQQSGITVYSDAMTTAYLNRATSSHIALSKGLWYYEFAIELVPTQIVSGVADMKINVYSQVYDSPSSLPSYYMIKNINAPISCNVQSTYTRMISGVVYSISDFMFDSQGFLSFGQTLSIEFDIGMSTVPSGAAFKFRQTGLHLVKLGV